MLFGDSSEDREEVQQLCPASGSSSRLEILQNRLEQTKDVCDWQTDAELSQIVWLSTWTDTPP